MKTTYITKKEEVDFKSNDRLFAKTAYCNSYQVIEGLINFVRFDKIKTEVNFAKKNIVNNEQSIHRQTIAEIVTILKDKQVPHLESVIMLGLKEISENLPVHLSTPQDKLAYTQNKSDEFYKKVAQRIKKG